MAYGQVSSYTESLALTITTGGTPQVILGAFDRKRLFIMNPWAATESLWIRFDTADPDGTTAAQAAAAAPSIELKPGDALREDGMTSNNQISAYAATSAHSFTVLYSK